MAGPVGRTTREANTNSSIAVLGLGALSILALMLTRRSQQRPPSSARDRATTTVNHASRSTGPADERGRDADHPAEIPVKGWRDILMRVYRSLAEDRVLAIAAGVTFYGLLALFPAIAALVSIYALFADPTTIREHIGTLAAFAPGQAIDLIGNEIMRIAATAEGKLGFGLIVGLSLSLWSANAGMKAMFDALNVVYDEREKRSFLRLNAITLLFTLGAIVGFLVAVGAVVAIPVVLKFLPIPGGPELFIRMARWPLLLVIVALALAVIYRYGPSRDRPRWRWVTPGSTLAALIWVAGSLVFSWYAANLGNFDKTYGSLGAAIGFLMWMWLSTIVVLLGGELDAEMEHQTARDSTVGRPKPLGSRGARMADTVGAAQH